MCFTWPGEVDRSVFPIFLFVGKGCNVHNLLTSERKFRLFQEERMMQFFERFHLVDQTEKKIFNTSLFKSLKIFLKEKSGSQARRDLQTSSACQRWSKGYRQRCFSGCNDTPSSLLPANVSALRNKIWMELFTIQKCFLFIVLKAAFVWSIVFKEIK